MAEYIYNEAQSVSLNSPLTFLDSIPCNRGYVIHDNETGIFILRGIVNNQCAKFATYQVTFNGNIAIPSGTPEAIAVAITVNGEPRPTSRAIFTPTADEFGNVTSTAIIKVPRGCCFSLSVEYVSGVDDATTPPVAITVENANLVINRIA